MNKTLPLDYHYGDEAEQYSFYRIPKLLFTSKYFKSLSAEAKILYGLMLDRMSLSIRNGWLDENNRVYIYFTLEDAMSLLGCGNSKIVAMFAELDTNKGVGLIERKKQGQGKPTIIYVKNFATVSNLKLEDEPLKEPFGTDIKTSQFQQSAFLENESQDLPKSNASNTDINYTELNYTESSSSAAQIDFSTTKIRDEDDDLEKLRNKTEYEYFSNEMPDKLSLIDVLLNIILTLRQENNPQYKRLLDEIDSCTVMEFLDEIKNISFNGVHNITAYLKKVFLEFIIKRDLQLSMI